jgi:hypothetical protein
MGGRQPFHHFDRVAQLRQLVGIRLLLQGRELLALLVLGVIEHRGLTMAQRLDELAGSVCELFQFPQCTLASCSSANRAATMSAPAQRLRRASGWISISSAVSCTATGARSRKTASRCVLASAGASVVFGEQFLDGHVLCCCAVRNSTTLRVSVWDIPNPFPREQIARALATPLKAATLARRIQTKKRVKSRR